MKQTLTELIDWETQAGLWNIRFKQVPVWMYLRDDFVSTTRPVPPKHKLPKIINILGSLLALIKLHIFANKYSSIAFLCNRRDVTDFWRHITKKNDEKCALLLHLEVKPNEEDKRFATCDFLNVLRIIVRKIGWLLYYGEYKRILAELTESLDDNKETKNAIKLTIGETLYNWLLAFILPKNKIIYYCSAGIPATEKFMGLHQCFEIQHGVIHTMHPGYIGWPPVKTGLIVYAEQYKTLLSQQEYKYGIVCKRFKSVHQPSQKPISFPCVIYSQPLGEVNSFIEQLCNDSRVSEYVFVKLHPRDYFNYNVPSEKLISDHHPSEVLLAIMYTTSIAEDFVIQNKDVVIYDVKVEGIDIKAYLTMYDTNPDCKLTVIDEYETLISRILNSVA